MGQAKRKEKAEDSTEPTPVASPGEPVPSRETWQPPAALPRLSRALVVGAVVLFNLPLLHYFLFRGESAATVAVPYPTQSFDNPAVIDTDFWSTGGQWRVVNGELLSPGVKNNPLWLKAKLPENVAVEFNVRSVSPEGDIKCEIFGDGSDHASGYVLIHGGWNNTVSIIARLDEHGASLAQLQAEAGRLQREKGLESADLVKTGVFRANTRMRVEANPFPVQIGKTYRWRIERQGSVLTWFIDGREFMRFDDPMPLKGQGHDRFGFSSWEAQLFFDDLSVKPL
ncbi:MAG: hypothetical protein INH41_08235 [Myxococcaceae bacterium]|jgi:hypothetical protein|nr:hypothetical protein [Myxococcaceae bacterium]MCA3012374.1 hypothetical protein [Myxococcaceae bacterium]